MLTKSLWVEAGLVNGALGQVVSIIYNTSTTPPNLALFVVVNFMHYKGPPWDNSNLTCNKGLSQETSTSHGLGLNNP